MMTSDVFLHRGTLWVTLGSACERMEEILKYTLSGLMSGHIQLYR